MRKAKLFITYLFTLVMIVSACGKADEPDIASSDRASSESVSSDKALEKTSSTVSSDAEEVELIYSETIEYGEVYNDNGLIIKTKEYVHTPEECYIILEFNNSTENEITVYEDAYSVNDRMDYYDTFRLPLEAKECKTAKMDISYTLQSIIPEDRNVKTIKTLLFVYDKVDKNGYYPYIEINTSIDDGIVVFKDYPVVYEDDEVAIEYSSTIDNVLYFNLLNKSSDIKEYSLDKIKIGEEMIYDFNAEKTQRFRFESNCYKEQVYPDCKGLMDIQIIGYDKDINELKELTFYLIDETAYTKNNSYTHEIHVVLDD